MTTPSLKLLPYLPTQRNFPNRIDQLAVVLDKMYIEVAQRVNERTIGVFANNFSATTGESWYLEGQPRKRQTLRQVYPFGAIATGATLAIEHGITDIVQFTRIYGTCITDHPDYRPIPFVSTNPNAVIELRVSSTQIIIINGSAAENIVSGLIVLEFISNTATNS